MESWTKYKDYWQAQPALKTILIQFIKDPSTQRLQLENGDIDIAENIPVDQIDQLKNNKDLNIHEELSLLVRYV